MDDKPLEGEDQLKARVRHLLDSARWRQRGTPEQMVRLLGELQPKGAVSRTAWYDWRNNPATVSALTLMRMLQILGPEAAHELVFGEVGKEAKGLAPPPAGDFAKREDLDRTQDDVAQLAQQIRYLNKVVEELAGTERMLEVNEKLGSPLVADLEGLLEQVRERHGAHEKAQSV